MRENGQEKKDSGITIQNNSTDYSDILNRILGKSKTTLFFVVFVMFVLSYLFGYKLDAKLDIFTIIWGNIFTASKINIPLTFVFSAFCILIARFIYSLGLSGLFASWCEKCYFWITKYFAKLYIDYSDHKDVLEIKWRENINQNTKALMSTYQEPIEIILKALEDDIKTRKKQYGNNSSYQIIPNNVLKQITDIIYKQYPDSEKDDKNQLNKDLTILINKYLDSFVTMYLTQQDNTIVYYSRFSVKPPIKILDGKDASEEFIALWNKLINLNYIENDSIKNSTYYPKALKNAVEKNLNINVFSKNFFSKSYITQLAKTIRTLYKINKSHQT